MGHTLPKVQLDCELGCVPAQLKCVWGCAAAKFWFSRNGAVYGERAGVWDRQGEGPGCWLFSVIRVTYRGGSRWLNAHSRCCASVCYHYVEGVAGSYRSCLIVLGTNCKTVSRRCHTRKIRDLDLRRRSGRYRYLTWGCRLKILACHYRVAYVRSRIRWARSNL